MGLVILIMLAVLDILLLAVTPLAINKFLGVALILFTSMEEWRPVPLITRVARNLLEWVLEVDTIFY